MGEPPLQMIYSTGVIASTACPSGVRWGDALVEHARDLQPQAVLKNGGFPAMGEPPLQMIIPRA